MNALMTPDEASNEFGYTKGTLKQLAVQGRIAVKEGWYLRSSIERYIEKPEVKRRLGLLLGPIGNCLHPRPGVREQWEMERQMNGNDRRMPFPNDAVPQLAGRNDPIGDELMQRVLSAVTFARANNQTPQRHGRSIGSTQH